MKKRATDFHKIIYPENRFFNEEPRAGRVLVGINAAQPGETSPRMLCFGYYDIDHNSYRSKGGQSLNT
jgi:hypothetical protein